MIFSMGNRFCRVIVAAIFLFFLIPLSAQESAPSTAPQGASVNTPSLVVEENNKDTTSVGESSKNLESTKSAVQEPPPFVIPSIKLSGAKKFQLLKTSFMAGNIDGLVGVSFLFGKVGPDKPSKKKPSKKTPPSPSKKSNAKEFAFNVLLKMDDKVINATVLDDFMMTVGSVGFTDESISLDSILLPKKFKAAETFASYVIGDLQFIYYDPVAISAALAPLKIKFITHTTDGTDYRIVMAKNKCIMQITTKRNDAGVPTTTVENYIRKYRYTVELLDGEMNLPEKAGKSTTNPVTEPRSQDNSTSGDKPGEKKD